MTKLNKITLIILLVLGLVYEAFGLISQSRSKRSIDITRQISCNGALDHNVTSCTENASLVLKHSSPVEFLFITNHAGNPVLTLINMFIFIVVLNATIKIKPYSPVSIKTLITIKFVFSLILVKLFVQWGCYSYTSSWFQGQSIYNNSGYEVTSEETSLSLLGVLFILKIWSDYLGLEIEKNNKQAENGDLSAVNY